MKFPSILHDRVGENMSNEKCPLCKQEEKQRNNMINHCWNIHKKTLKEANEQVQREKKV